MDGVMGFPAFWLVVVPPQRDSRYKRAYALIVRPQSRIVSFSGSILIVGRYFKLFTVVKFRSQLIKHSSQVIIP